MVVGVVDICGRRLKGVLASRREKAGEMVEKSGLDGMATRTVVWGRGRGEGVGRESRVRRRVKTW